MVIKKKKLTPEQFEEIQEYMEKLKGAKTFWIICEDILSMK